VPLKEEGLIEAPIYHHQNGDYEFLSAAQASEKRQTAATKYKVLSRTEVSLGSLDSYRPQISLIQLQIAKGRKHQIRLHLSQILQTPIIGDRKYFKDNLLADGLKRRFKMDDSFMALHSWKLTGAEINLVAPIPLNFRNLLSLAQINIPQ
jgi:23S rRNA-/tRNA-specific pseudouridylate synthase